ncbi:GDP-mannose-dependent alpha-(1-6)-phosphatidylinositol monomannoside mannosyltransferase [compost metagenome]
MSSQIIWRGFVYGSTGYSRASREYILALDKIGVDVKVEALVYQGETVEPIDDEHQRKRIAELIEKPYARDKKSVLICHIQPDGVNVEQLKQFYDYVIINTVWETLGLPASWNDSLKQADAILLPSKHNIYSFKEAGYWSEVFHIPHGADTIRFTPENPPLPLKDTIGKFTFLCVSTWQHRKSPELLLRAFWEEFKEEENVALIYKIDVGGNKRNETVVLEEILRYKEKLQIKDNATTLLSLSRYTDEQLGGLYTAADAFVLPSRGEGVGLPYIEALASGKPVIATGWGGQTDFLNEGNSYVIDYRVENIVMDGAISPTYDHLFMPTMQWAEPDLVSIRKQMRHLFEHQDECKEKGLQGRKDMESMTWEKSAVEISNVVESLLYKNNENEKGI